MLPDSHSGPWQMPSMQAKPDEQELSSLQDWGASHVPVSGLHTALPWQSWPLVLQFCSQEPFVHTSSLGHWLLSEQPPHMPVSGMHTWPSGQAVVVQSWQLGSLPHMPVLVSQIWHCGQETVAFGLLHA
jgi:hypothetical protein